MTAATTTAWRFMGRFSVARRAGGVITSGCGRRSRGTVPPMAAKIAFIGAGSFGFTRGLVRDLLTFPLLRGRDALPDGHRPRAARRSSSGPCETHRRRRATTRPRSTATTDRREALEGRRRRALHHPGRRRATSGGTTSRSRRSTGGHQRRRHPRRLGHLPRPAHHPRDARHLPRHGASCAPTPSCSTTPTPWPCSAGPCSGETDRSRSPACATACRARRRCWPTGSARRRARSTTSARASTTSPGTSSSSGRARTPTRCIRARRWSGPKIYKQEMVRNEMFLAPGLLRHRVQRPQLRVQLVVPQAARPDREVLHARHRLEPRASTPTS